jgi:hypothetical protein
LEWQVNPRGPVGDCCRSRRLSRWCQRNNKMLVVACRPVLCVRARPHGRCGRDDCLTLIFCTLQLGPIHNRIWAVIFDVGSTRRAAGFVVGNTHIIGDFNFGLILVEVGKSSPSRGNEHCYTAPKKSQYLPITSIPYPFQQITHSCPNQLAPPSFVTKSRPT